MGKKKVTTQTAESAVAEKAAVDAAAAKAGTAAAGKRGRKIEAGRAYINASYNNTVVTITDQAGNVITWASAGSLGFSGPKKATPFASQKVIAAITEKIKATGPQNLHVIVKGIGSGRDSAIRSLINFGFNLLSIKDATPVPHNGPRPQKVRRV